MTDIRIDPYQFRICHIHGAVDISFERDVDQDMERRNNVARHHPNDVAALDELFALPIPLSVHSPIVDRDAEIVTTAFGVGVKILARENDPRLVEQGWTSRFERSQHKW